MDWGFYMQGVGGRVKSLRLSKRLSQEELAAKCKVRQPSIANIERGKTKNIKGYVLEALAMELSSTTSFILDGADSSDDHEHEMLCAEMEAIFRGLELADKETLLRMARGLLLVKKQNEPQT